jgi:uncharacterized damage-inducible protein DinB
MPRPQNNQYYAPYFQRYIDLTKGDSIAELITNHEQEIHIFYNSIPEEKSMYAYEANKWTMKEVLQHIIDCERVFMYRALHISRKDAAPLSGFDENSWSDNSLANERSLDSLKEEFNALHKSTVLLLQSFTDNQLLRKGIAGNNEVDVNALAYIDFGHILHHKKILQEKYLQ